MAPPPSWPRRLINATPPMPDWLFVAFCWLMFFGLGVITGMTWCVGKSVQQAESLLLAPRPSLQQQLDALDQRVRTLEQRRVE